MSDKYPSKTDIRFGYLQYANDMANKAPLDANQLVGRLDISEEEAVNIINFLSGEGIFKPTEIEGFYTSDHTYLP